MWLRGNVLTFGFAFAALALAFALASANAHANSDGTLRVTSIDSPASLDGKWRFRAGDGPIQELAAPSFDDASWTLVDAPRGLGEQGQEALIGIYWMRVRVDIPDDVTRELSIRLGSIDSAAEIYVDGVRVGQNGVVSAHHADALDAHDRPSIWPVPLEATRDGELVIAIRAWRSPLRMDSAPGRGGITAGPLLIGTTDDVMRAQYLKDIDKLLSGVVVLVVGLYHLQLFRRRREQMHYFWFGVFCLFMSAYLLSSTDASNWFLGTMPHARMLWASLILTLPTFVQFLWPFLERKIPWWWRLNQVLMIAYALLAVVWPTQWFVLKFIVFFELFLLLPLMAGVTGLVIVSAWRGNKEARTLLLGTLGLVVAAGNNIVLERTTLQLPNLMSYAMALFVFSIAVSLGNRFSRVFRELDEKNAALIRMDRLAEDVRRLNKQVHAKVKDRSDELSKALSLLAQPSREGHVAGAITDGTVLDGRFAIERALGAGGMGAVYAGRDLVTNQPVAVKVMKASSVSEVDALHRFLREARAVVAVEHAAIVRMLHVDISGDGIFYQVQELVDGITLEDALRVQLDVGVVARLGAVLAEALAAAHAAGVIHRDVKPSNIMLTRVVPGVKLLDFGVAKLTVHADDALPSDQTGTGRYIGTPAYMAPEQRYIADADVTDRVDIYALGLVLFRALTGGMPGRVIVNEARMPASLRAVVDECLRDDPSARPNSTTLATRLSTVADALGAPAALTDAWGDLVSERTQTQERGITDIMRELVRT